MMAKKIIEPRTSVIQPLHGIDATDGYFYLYL